MFKIILMKSLWSHFLIFIVIPLNPTEWFQIPYGNIPTHHLSFENGLSIDVNNSASALIYRLERPVKMKKIHLDLEQIGSISYGENKVGEKKGDDFPFRLGLVVAGDKKLSWGQSLLAPSWVKELYKLAHDHDGLEKVYYFVVAQQSPLYTKRIHPLSELLEEEIIGEINNGIFNQEIILSKEMSEKKVIALWVSSDGDDTHSKFKIIVKKINLEVSE
jgi:hypothetical protein